MAVHYSTPLQIRAFFHLAVFIGLFYGFRRFWSYYGSTETTARLIAYIAIIISLYGFLQDYGFDFAVKSGGVRDWRANVVATLGNPNFLAGYLGISLPPIIAYGLRKNASWRAFLLTTHYGIIGFCLYRANLQRWHNDIHPRNWSRGNSGITFLAHPPADIHTPHGF